MGFLERLKRQKEEEKLRKDAEAARARWLAQQALVVEPRETKKDKHKRSVRFFKESGVGELLDQLMQIDPTASYASNYYRKPREDDFKSPHVLHEFKDTSFGSIVQFAPTSDGNGWGGISAYYFIVEANPDGDIWFGGSKLGGRASVPRSEWVKDPSVLENALGKAYAHPKSYTYIEEQDTGTDTY